MLPIAVLYCGVVFASNNFLSFGEVKWYERVIVWYWPVTYPLIALIWFVRLIFWA